MAHSHKKRTLDLHKKSLSHHLANAACFALPFVLIAIFLICTSGNRKPSHDVQNVLENIYGDVRVLALQLVVLSVTASLLHKKHSSQKVRAVAWSTLCGYMWLAIIVSLLVIRFF